MVPELKYLIIFVIVLFALYTLLKNKETFLGDVVINAYSDMHCIEDDQPLVRLFPRNQPTTFQCLSTTGTGDGCIKRSTINVPSNYACKGSARNVNLFLSRDGIRQVNLPQTRNAPFGKVYWEFENLRTNSKPRDPSMNLSLVTCTPKGLLSGDNHWCGQLWKTVEPICEKQKFEQGIFSSLCDNVKNELSKANEHTTNEIVTSANNIAALQMRAQCKSDCTRQRQGTTCRQGCDTRFPVTN